MYNQEFELYDYHLNCDNVETISINGHNLTVLADIK